MRAPIALLASTALLMPAAVIATPAEAAPDTTTADRIKNCSKTRHGVTVKVRIRERGDFTRVRLSHPDGRGVFRERRIEKVTGAFGFFPDGPGATYIDRGRVAPSGRFNSKGSGNTFAYLTFRLHNGKAIRLSCEMHES